ncbi:hypothetical protein M441DRAFT_70199 [Trichoderma asperellum CBS 433.97]|uniref:ferric-chelate reductase (NADPH) n=1 Tax=Trichoderma asperellum (strain ATCC 204424 / CBS 433.97 / NBRC 101777) TaxID=1042311 RepID=A0A2T3Z6F5_TRIA4|nr:hypothetical protein M441DRAFT_70199 [Trichoderma asperellum CBS 433.97]PTB40388.1 hypothetical protein M441DRAFT_70199 [Trichoderma asperellum CBS 433.97]
MDAAIICSIFVLLPAKAIGYCFLVNRHRLIGPFTVASAFLQLIYVGSNIVSLVYGINSVVEAASRAGTLALINLAPLYFSTHLSFLADIFGVSLATYRQLHRSCGLVAVAHVIFHGAFALAHRSHLTKEVSSTDWYSLIGAIAMILLVLLSISFFRKRWYEIFLRLHQTLSIAVMVFVIRHLISVPDFQWIPVYIFIGIFFSLAAFYIMILIYRNTKLGKNFARLRATGKDGIMTAIIEMPRPLIINPGQYLNIWVPSLSLFSSHPFTVTSWAPFPQEKVELLIEERSGFTAKLFRHSCKTQNGYRVFFSGPHGSSIPDWEFDSVLIFATGFGIATILPYLIKLCHGYKERKGRSKRIHLVWKVYLVGE